MSPSFLLFQRTVACRLTLLRLMLLSFLRLSGPAHAQSDAYTVFEMAGAGDGIQVPAGFNSSGDVVGRGPNSVESSTRATIWRQYSRAVKLLPPLFAGEFTSASGINDLDQIVGAFNTDQALVPFFWTAASGMQRLPLLPGHNAGQASAINNHGQVVGYSSGPGGARAFIWSPGKGVRDLGLLPGGNYSKARGVNDAGEIIGTGGTAAGAHAVFWSTDGRIHDLGTLAGDTSSTAMGINSAGDVVGYSKGAGMRAFRWTKAGGMQDLGVLKGGNSSRAFSINASRRVVGTSASATGDRAFVWDPEVGMKDLNLAIRADQGLVLVEAHLINNRGQIVAMGARREHSTDHVPAAADADVCAPAPPVLYLLTPSDQVLSFGH